MNVEMNEIGEGVVGQRLSAAAAPSSYCNSTILNDDNTFQEWRTLKEEAWRITLESNVLTVVWKVCKFFFNEGNPFVFAYVLMNISGSESWVNIFITFVANFVASFVIAFFWCNEKREIHRARIRQPIIWQIWDVLYKTIKLMIDWVTEWSRDRKRKRTINIVEDNICRNDEIGLKKAIGELPKFYSSHVRYLREDILVTTIRSFILAMIVIYNICDPEFMTLRLAKISDVFKFLYVVWFIIKISCITNSFQDAERKYVASLQLKGATCQHTRPTGLIEICQYHQLNKFNKEYLFPWAMIVLEFLINFMLMASRILTATLCMIIYYPLGILLWYGFVMGTNWLLLESLLLRRIKSNTEAELRSKFDNSPSGYSTYKNKWIMTLVTTIFFNYGFSRQGLKGAFAWKSLFAIPSIIIFTVILFYSNGTAFLLRIPVQNTSLNVSSTSCISNYNRTGFLECIHKELECNPIDVMSYLGGINMCIIIVFFMWAAGFMFEIIQKYLQRREDIDLNKFEVFPYHVAADFYLFLIVRLLNTPADSARDKAQAIRSLMAFTLMDSTTFNAQWSRYNTMQYCQRRDFEIDDDLICKVIVDRALQYNVLEDFTFQERERLDLNIVSEQPINLKHLYDRCHDIIWTHEHISYAHSYELEVFENIDKDRIKLEELIAIKQLKSLRDHNHPLEPNIFNGQQQSLLYILNESTVISNIFNCIKRDPGFKRKYIILFIVFCHFLDMKLAHEINSYRIEGIFKMLDVNISG